jgi:hypothetical protein
LPNILCQMQAANIAPSSCNINIVNIGAKHPYLLPIYLLRLILPNIAKYFRAKYC